MSDEKPKDAPAGADLTPGAPPERGKRLGWPHGWLRRTPVLAALFVLLATAALAVARYTTTPPVYVASQTFAIIVTLPDSSTTTSSYDQSLVAQQAIQVAQLLTTPGFLIASALDNDVAGRLQSLPGDATTRAATAAQIGQALNAQPGGLGELSGQVGAEVTLTARWATATGAQAVLAAATAALQFDATQLVQVVIAAASPSASPTAASGATPTASVAATLTPTLTPGELVGVQAMGAPMAAVRGGSVVGAARTRLYEQLALAVVVALLLGAALQWALMRRP
ncbi:MAG TPA: hypothetical protein VMV29_13800 [Ktedonobacterales bacterium]|nr:hypothetical protein [Ktedonobacterales bacterium]